MAILTFVRMTAPLSVGAPPPYRRPNSFSMSVFASFT